MERKNKWINLISRFKNTMLKNKAKALPVSNSKEKHKQFTGYYKQDNFSSNITEKKQKNMNNIMNSINLTKKILEDSYNY